MPHIVVHEGLHGIINAFADKRRDHLALAARQRTRRSEPHFGDRTLCSRACTQD
jgi:hypothetical protein